MLAEMPISGYTDLASSTLHMSFASVQNSTLKQSQDSRTVSRNSDVARFLGPTRARRRKARGTC
eukprot:557767-Pyramimonas_sp.AAC.1